MSLTIQECIRKVKQAYPDLQPYAYVEVQGRYVFNLIAPGADPKRTISEFHAVDPESGEVSGCLPTLTIFKNREFREKWENANLVKEMANDVSHSQFRGYRIRTTTNESPYLEHYGIRGQKWGEQNGPPYPLDQKTHDKVVKGATTGAYDNTMAIIGASAIASYLGVKLFVGYGRKLVQKKKTRDNVELSKELIGDIADVGKQFSEEKPPKQIEGSHTADQDMAAVNPKYRNHSIQGTYNNCAMCAIAYDLRRRGYDVTANASKGSNYIDLIAGDVYEGAKTEELQASSFPKLYEKAASKYPEGARGIISIYGNYGNGHSMAFEIADGQTVVRCPQTNEKVSPTDQSLRLFSPKMVSVVRTDNLGIKMENIHKVCSELKPGWKQTLEKEKQSKLMTEAEKRKSLEAQWKKQNKGRRMDAEAREVMDNWVKGNMWSAPWTYGSDSLMHYGIRNMHWGERRFQDKNGKLTPEGKIRYRKNPEKSERSEKSEKSGKTTGFRRSEKTGNVSRPDGKKWRTSEAQTLSDEELNTRNSRLQRERQYRDMTTPQWKKTGKDWSKEAFKKIFIGTATALAVIAMKNNYEKLIEIGADFVKNKALMNSVRWVL